MSKEKNYSIDVDIKHTVLMPARNKKEAIEKVKASFVEEYGIDLANKEIVKVERMED